ncbi:MAG: glycosyltransferase family 39 protein [Candidatus Sulfotelmatobacter sp.]
MTRLFTRERFGRPQFLAGALLLAFLAQAIWLVRSELRSSDGPSAPEQARIAAGWRQFHGGGIAGAPFPDPPGSLPVEISQNGAFDTQHSPLLSLVTAAPFLAWPQRLLNQEFSSYWRWLPRLPFLACGMALGASLWYVARRLCGNSGGFLALTLYCFSPSMIQASAVWHTEPEILAAWGTFGAIFTAIAVAHTLYAPREVVLWNWRRIVLLGVSLAIAVGSQFSMIVVVPLALGFLLYLAPIRRGAALTIWTAACFVALAIFFATYFFHPHAFSEAMRHASFWGATWRSFTLFGVYRQVGLQILRACPAFALLLPVAITTYLVWPRTRYFGSTAPGLVALLLIGLGMAHPSVAGAGFLLASIPFLLIFVSGVLADLMETPFRQLVTACVCGLLAAYILWSLLALSHIPRG